jgi:hypothetical protein
MDFIREKLKISSIEAINNVVDYLLEHPEKIETTVNEALFEQHKTSWRFCWMLRHLAEKDKDLLLPYKPIIFVNIFSIKDESSLANLLKTIIILGIDTENESEILDFAIEKLISSHKSAVKYYILDVFEIFAKKYPELITELTETLKLASINFATDSLQRKSKKLIQKWSKYGATSNQ